MKTNFTLSQSDLASRTSAALLRAQIEEELKVREVVLDFSSVQSVSASYADELIGVLVSRHSLSWVFDRLELKGLTPATARSFASAIRRRLDSGLDAVQSSALAVAREALSRKQGRLIGESCQTY